MRIQIASDSDLDNVLSVERAAFGSDEEANIVRELLKDSSAMPVVSLLAFQESRAVGHILFSRARLEPDAPLSISIMAPLAVVPDAQRQGIGGKLIEHGLQILSKSGVDLVFVLGHPNYYPRYGFKPAGNLGFEATYPIPDKRAGAWMVQALRPKAIGAFTGKVICTDTLNKQKYW
ncbi:MAG: N-acetyltransferase [Deltaproteobacteria bacterium]|nr:N-acetyltransferase [Deltaproteobacteria bacterium]